MKKIISLVITVFLFTIIGIFPASADEEISAILNSATPTVSNMTVSMPTGGTVTTKTVGGRTGWVLSIKKVVDSYVLTNASLLVDIDDSVMCRLSGSQTVYVEVDYYDAGNGNFCIGYDSTTVSEKSGDTVNLGNTKTWKTAVFELDRPFFGNRLSGNDFAIRIMSDYMKASSSEVVIGSVRVRVGDVSPLHITIGSEEAGNIFFNAQRPTLNVKMKNLDKQDYVFDIVYEVTDAKSGETVFSLEDNIRINSHMTYSKELGFDKLKFVIYEITVTAVAPEGYSSTAKSEFSRVKSPDETDSDYGVCLHFTGSKSEDVTDAALELIERGGFKNVRDALHWHNVEKTPGVYSIPEGLIKQIDMSNDRGIETLLILGYVNAKAYPDLRHYTKTDIDATQAEAEFEAYLDAYENYVYNTVLLLGDKVKYYEVGNEYNLTLENTVYPDEGIHNEATDYAKILERAYEAIKRANPDAVVVGGALANEGTTVFTEYITELYESGAAEWMDALSVHLYSEASPDSNAYIIHDELAAVREIIDSYGSKQELWVSEYCFVSRKGGLTQHKQAVYGAKSEILLKVKGLIDKSFWYTVASALPASDDSYNISYGLLNSKSDKNEEVSVTFAAKPVYLAVCAYKSIFSGTEFTENLSSGNNYIYRFTDEFGRSYYALWSGSSTNASVTLDTEYRDIAVYDMFGNDLGKLSSDSGVFEITIGKEPIYVKEYEESIKVTYLTDNRKYELTGSLDAENLNVMIAVLKPNKTYEDFKSNPLESTAHMDLIKTDNAGKFKTQFKLGSDHGIYTLLIKPSDNREMTLMPLVVAKPIFLCDFEELSAGTEVTNDVLKSLGWNGSAGTVGEIVDDAVQGKCLYYSDGAGAGFDLGREISSGVVKISFLYKRTNECGDNFFNISANSGAKDLASAGTGGADRATLAYHGPQIKPYDKVSGTVKDDVVSTSKNTWVKLEFVIDMDTRTFTAYVNGTATENAYALNIADTEKSIKSFVFHNNNVTDFYIDDIVVTYEKIVLSDLKIELDESEILNHVSPGDKINVAVRATNTTGATKRVILVYASYNEDKLVDVKVMPVDIASSTDIQQVRSEDYTVKSGITITETKAFVWDNQTKIMPLIQSVKYPK